MLELELELELKLELELEPGVKPEFVAPLRHQHEIMLPTPK